MTYRWKTVDTVDNDDMMVPHALQQQVYIRSSGVVDPRDEHRLVPVTDLVDD